MIFIILSTERHHGKLLSMSRFFQYKGEVNYLYFSCFLLFLMLLSVLHYLNWEQPDHQIAFFFILYAIGQSLLEVGLFILVSYFLRRWAPSWLFALYIGFSFVAMLLHFTHFTMVRLMDASLGYIFNFLFGSGINHLIAGFQALNMNWTMIILTVSTFLLMPILGLSFYWLTARIIKHKPLQLSLTQITSAIGAISALLFCLDLVCRPFLDRHMHSKYQRRLPLGTTFLTPIRKTLPLPTPLNMPRFEPETILSEKPQSHLSNIYFFVVETLRQDFINEETAPHLSAFGQENIQFNDSFANANATHLSWFALFHSDYPLHWNVRRDTWLKGSTPLRMLKNMGYQIQVFSSANLRYFGMDKLIFGSQRQLADRIEEYSFDRTLEPCDCDALAFDALKEHLALRGQCYIIFLDATHSEYSFPKDFPTPFLPIAKEIDYLSIHAKSPELEYIKNRYRNAIHYIDHLFGHFFTLLKTEGLFDDAIIAITGDHGEEFFEEGALFHGTHLNTYQTKVPIFLKFPSEDWIPQTPLATHVDLFPSVLHYLTKQSDFSTFFDGQSIFSLQRWPGRVAVLQNGPDAPREFSIETPDSFLRAQILSPNQLEMVEWQGPITADLLTPLTKKNAPSLR